MPLTEDIKMISVDDHLIEPPGVWIDRIPARYHDVCPQIEEVAEDRVQPFASREVHLRRGMQVWRYEDIVEPMIGLIANRGTAVEDRNFTPLRYDQILRGTWDPVARLTDMDTDGVWAQTPFPSFPGFCGNKFVAARDKELALLCVQAYNDFLLDEWVAAARDRYIALVILPLWDPALCTAEIQRCAAKGANGITFPDAPTNLGLPSLHSDAWDAPFAAAADANLPLCLHFGGSKVLPFIAKDAPQAAVTAVMGITLFNTMCELAMSSFFRRHPRLRIVFSEGGIGWIPYALMRMDQVWEAYRDYPLTNNVDRDLRPSDMVREHIWGCFIDDPVGVRDRELIGVDRLLWESDFPHGDSIWPNSRTNAEKVMADVPTDEVRQIVETNARALFHFDR